MATAGTAINKRAEHPAEIENLPVLFTRLGDDVMQLFDAKVSLLKVEVREEANAFLRGGVVIAMAALVALIGLALASTAARGLGSAGILLAGLAPAAALFVVSSATPAAASSTVLVGLLL